MFESLDLELARGEFAVVENGAVTAPVNNFRFNESPLDLLRRADQLAQDRAVLHELGGEPRRAIKPLGIAPNHQHVEPARSQFKSNQRAETAARPCARHAADALGKTRIAARACTRVRR